MYEINYKSGLNAYVPDGTTICREDEEEIIIGGANFQAMSFTDKVFQIDAECAVAYIFILVIGE